MKGIKNQYNEVALEKFKKVAKIAFDLKKKNPKDVAAMVYKLNRIGPNGMVKIHFRSMAFFLSDVTKALSEAFAISDDLTFNATPTGNEVIIILGVHQVCPDWKDTGIEDCGFYNSMEEIGK